MVPAFIILPHPVLFMKSRLYAVLCLMVMMLGCAMDAGAASLQDWVNDPAGEAERQVAEAQRLAREAEQRAREAAASGDAQSLARAAQASQAAASATQRASEATAELGRVWDEWQKKLPTLGSGSGGAGTLDARAFQQQAEQARVSLQRKWSELQQQLSELGRLDHQSPKELMRKAEQQAERALAAVKNYEGLLAQVQGLMQNPGSFQQALDWFQRLPFSHPMPDILAMNANGISVLLIYLIGFSLLRRLLFGKRR